MTSPRRRTLVPAVALVACGFVPIDLASKETLFGQIWAAFAEDWMNGILLTVVLGMPYIFGLQVVMVSLVRSRLAAASLPLPLALLHIEAALIGLVMLHEEPSLAAGSLLGLVLVSTLRWVGQSVQARREGLAVSVSWWVRYGGMFLFSAFAWLNAQILKEGLVSPALIGTALAAALIVVAAGPERGRRAARTTL